MTEPYKQKIEKTHVALVHETVAESLWRDAGTVAVFLVLWSVGYFADSIVLQAVGVVFAVMFAMARGMLSAGCTNRESASGRRHAAVTRCCIGGRGMKRSLLTKEQDQ